jgi:hypothetical protein
MPTQTGAFNPGDEPTVVPPPEEREQTADRDAIARWLDDGGRVTPDD